MRVLVQIRRDSNGGNDLSLSQLCLLTDLTINVATVVGVLRKTRLSAPSDSLCPPDANCVPVIALHFPVLLH